MKILKILKNIVLTMFYIFGMNFFLSNLGYNISINVFSFLIVYFLKFPGLVFLLILSRW